MRFEPIEISTEEKEQQQKNVSAVTEKLAIGLAAFSVFIFFFKLLFF